MDIETCLNVLNADIRIILPGKILKSGKLNLFQREMIKDGLVKILKR